MHIPLRELGERFTELPAGQVLVVCRSGDRSAHATAYLVDQGFDAVNLAGGLIAWHGAGRPLTTDDGAAGPRRLALRRRRAERVRTRGRWQRPTHSLVEVGREGERRPAGRPSLRSFCRRREVAGAGVVGHRG